MVNKIFSKSALTLALSLTAAGSAWAEATCNEPNPFPANNEQICENVYGGTFSDNTCIVSTTDTQECGDSDFKLVSTATTVYTKDGGTCTTNTGQATLTCLNPSNNEAAVQACLSQGCTLPPT